MGSKSGHGKVLSQATTMANVITCVNMTVYANICSLHNIYKLMKIVGLWPRGSQAARPGCLAGCMQPSSLCWRRLYKLNAPFHSEAQIAWAVSIGHGCCFEVKVKGQGQVQRRLIISPRCLSVCRIIARMMSIGF